MQQAALPAVITQTRFGPLALAERLCRVAVRYFGLRYLAAFGPDVPDGVISLDAMALDHAGGPFVPGPGGLISFTAGDPAHPVHRSGDALLAAIAVYLVTARVQPGDRILSLVPQSDLRGLVTGLGAALVAGAGLETLPVFEARSFADALGRPLPTRLVVPAALERNLAASRLPRTLEAIVLAHRAPGRLGPRTLASEAHRPVIDVVAFDETALLAGAREANDVALALTHPERAHLFSTLMALRRDPDGHLAFRGRACHAEPLQRDIADPRDGRRLGALALRRRRRGRPHPRHPARLNRPASGRPAGGAGGPPAIGRRSRRHAAIALPKAGLPIHRNGLGRGPRVPAPPNDAPHRFGSSAAQGVGGRVTSGTWPANQPPPCVLSHGSLSKGRRMG